MKRANIFNDPEEEESRLIEESRRRRQQIKFKHANNLNETPMVITVVAVEEIAVIERIEEAPKNSIVPSKPQDDDMFADDGPDEVSTKHVIDDSTIIDS